MALAEQIAQLEAVRDAAVAEGSSYQYAVQRAVEAAVDKALEGVDLGQSDFWNTDTLYFVDVHQQPSEKVQSRLADAAAAVEKAFGVEIAVCVFN